MLTLSGSVRGRPYKSTILQRAAAAAAVVVIVAIISYVVVVVLLSFGRSVQLNI